MTQQDALGAEAYGGPLEWNEMAEARATKIIGEVPGAPGWMNGPLS